MTKEQAREIIELIIQDLSDRKGLGDEWQECDDEIQMEIAEEWASIMLNVCN